MKFLSVVEVARVLKVPTRAISDAFYAGKLDDGACLRIGGRRAIPDTYIPKIREVLAATPRRTRRASLGAVAIG